MIFFSSNKGSDGVTRYFQGSCAAAGDGIASIKVYMTHGLTSTGVLGMTEEGKTVIEKSPYLQTDGDVEAAKAFVQDMVEKITKSQSGFVLQKEINAAAIIEAVTSGNHYAGTTKMGTDDGRKGGSSVVDTNAKVYGMDNLVSVKLSLPTNLLTNHLQFVSDAGIHPGLPTGNIQTIVMAAAEAAVAKILAC
jgi:cellobiose dehydrogenase (acceptor)